MIHQVLHPRIILHQILQPRLHLDGFGERVIEPLLGSRDELGDRVGLSERKTERAADIFDGRLGLKRSKVAICATRSAPYLSLTYWITWALPRMQKSTSISGMERRSGLRKRSNKST